MLVSELLTRYLIPSILTVSVVGLKVAFWWEDRRSSVPAHVQGLRSWGSLSTREQRAQDDAVLDAAEEAETGTLRSPRERLREYPDVRVDAEDAARLAVERAANTNALYHP